MKIVLFGLTGLGNVILDALLSSEHELKLLVTRKEKGPYPYYKAENIAVKARSKNIKTIEVDEKDKTWVDLVIPEFSEIDLIICATYHALIPKNIVQKSKLGGFNIHLSLLPKHKGPCPVFWAIYNGDEQFGFSCHDLTEKIDSGPVFFQRSYPLNYMTMGQALYFLHKQIGKELHNILSSVTNKSIINIIGDETYERRPTTMNYNISLDGEKDKIMSKIRSCLPYPGAWLQYNDELIRVTSSQYFDIKKR